MIHQFFLFQALLSLTVSVSPLTAAWMTKSPLAISTLRNYDVYEFGEELIFNCTGANAQHLSIQINNNDIPLNMTQVLGTKVLSSVVPIVPKYFQHEYNSINCFKDDSIFVSEYIKVDYAIVHDVNIDDKTCRIDRSSNLMECSWAIGKYCYPKNINVTFSVKSYGSDVWVSCNPKMDESLSCDDNTSYTQSCLFKDGDHFYTSALYTYLKLQVTNTRRNISKTFESGVLSQVVLVQPAMVKNMTARNITSRTALIKWSIPIEVDTVIVRINVSSKRNETLTVERKKMENYFLEDLKPFTKYFISVDSKMKGGHYYSIPANISFVTASDVPEKPPVLFPGSFYLRNNPCGVQKRNTKRNVTVYWKSIPEEYSNGRIVKYILSANEESSGQIYYTEVHGNQTSAEVLLKCDSSYKINIKASTTAGFSNNTAMLKVPANKDIIPTKQLVVQSPDDKSFVNISWEQNDKLTSYAIIWCMKSPDNSRCDGEIHHKPTQPLLTNQLILYTNITGPIGQLRFGVTGVSEPLQYSSGITWEACRYRINQAPAIPESLYIAKESSYNSLVVMWSSPKCDWQSGYVHRYIIKFCLLKKQPDCKEKEFLPHSVAEYTLDGLTAFQRYSVQLQAVSPLGIKSPYTAMIYAFPIGPTNVARNISLGVAGAVLVAIVVFCVIWQKYKMRRRPLDFDVPTVSSKISSHKETDAKYYETGVLLAPQGSAGYIHMSDPDGINKPGETVNDKVRHISNDSGTGSYDAEFVVGENIEVPGDDDVITFDEPVISDEAQSALLEKDKIGCSKQNSNIAYLQNGNGYISQDNLNQGIYPSVKNVDLETMQVGGDETLITERKEGKDHNTRQLIQQSQRTYLPDDRKSSTETNSTELPTDYVRTTFHSATSLHDNCYLSRDKISTVLHYQTDDIITSGSNEVNNKKFIEKSDAELPRTTLHTAPLLNNDGYVLQDELGNLSNYVCNYSKENVKMGDTDDIITERNEDVEKKLSEANSEDLQADTRTAVQMTSLMNDNGYLPHDKICRVSQNVCHVSNEDLNEGHVDITPTDSIEGMEKVTIKSECVPMLPQENRVNEQCTGEFVYIKVEDH